MWTKKVFLIILVCVLSPVIAPGQHPFSLKWRVIKTDNAKIIYPSYLGFDAARLATGLDYVVKADTVNIGLLPKKMPVVVSTTSNTSNGYTSLSPYKMMLYSRPMESTTLGSAEWYQNLLTHEYRHIVQYRMMDRGLTRAAHCVFGYLGWSALMYSVPQWFYEGDAVYAETVLSSQGRGRSASFDAPLSAMVMERGKLYPYDKIVHRSYRDFVPNHYPVGYMLVTGAKRRHGADIFTKISKRQSWYSVWPFAFGCGYKHFTGESLAGGYEATFSDLRNQYAQRADEAHVKSYPTVTNPSRRIYTNYLSPYHIGKDSILCVKSSLSKASRFVLMDSHGREYKVLGHTEASDFDTDGRVIVYNTTVPDVRWTLRSYSDIAVFDIGTGSYHIVTQKSKYGNPYLSPGGSKIVAVDFSDDRVCRLVVMALRRSGTGYSTEILKAFYSRPLEYIRCPNFVSEDKVVFISNYGDRNTLRLLDLNTMVANDITAPSPENISDIMVSEDGAYIYYVSDISGIDNVHRVAISGGEPVQVTNSKYGVTDISSADGVLYFSQYTANGYDIAYCKADEKVAAMKSKKLEYFAPMLPKEPAGVLDRIATELPDTTILSKSKPYSQFADPFRPLGLMPNWGEDMISINLSTANNLETIFASVTETYDRDPGVWRTDVGISYYGFYPVISFAASLGDNGDKFLTQTGFGKFRYVDYKWRENIYKVSVSLPLNFSRLWYSQSLNVGASLQVHDLSGKPISSFEDYPDGKMTVMSGSLSYSWSSHSAYRDFKSPLSVALSGSAYQSLSGARDASMLLLSASVTVPGIFRQNYLTLGGNAISQNQSQNLSSLYLFDHTAFDLRGYSSTRMQTFSRLSAEYAFPLGYPDIGIPSVVWVKRFRGGVYGDLARGEIFRQRYDYASVGAKVLADFCVLRLNYNITAGISVAKGLKKNGLEGTETAFTLSLPF